MSDCPSQKNSTNFKAADGDGCRRNVSLLSSALRTPANVLMSYSGERQSYVN